MELDPDGKIDFMTFSDGTKNVQFVGTVDQYSSDTYVIDNVIDRVSGWNGGTTYSYALEEALTVEEALHAYTVAGAYASFEEGQKGRIKPGQLADLTVLGQDPRQVEPSAIAEVPVTLTIVGGDTSYEG